MSWVDDIENIVFTIVTGDGRQWQPKWKPTGRDIEFNAAEFEFKNVRGTLVIRQEPKGTKHDLEFYFDGENAVSDGNAFEVSARDKKAWLIRHPFYGNIECHPLRISQDNSLYNCSKFNVSVIETIRDVYPIEFPIIEDRVKEKTATANVAQEESFSASGEIDRNALRENVVKFDSIYSKIFGTDSELLAFKNTVNNAIVELESATATPLTMIRATTAVINYPATITQTVQARISSYKESIDYLYSSLPGTREGKFRYESLGGAIVGAAIVASSTNVTDDYEVKSNVLSIQAQISAIYSAFLTNLDALQTDRVDEPDSYTPNFSSMNALNEAVNYTISNLFAFAFEAKQEREFLVDYDTNLILLTHRFYGLDPEDTNINKFIKTNNIGLKEMLSISKGRKIIYYV